jgi:hypothetical protein
MRRISHPLTGRDFISLTDEKRSKTKQEIKDRKSPYLAGYDCLSTISINNSFEQNASLG